MEHSIWDQEFRELEARIDSIETIINEGSVPEQRTLSKKKKVIQEVETYLTKVNLRFKRLNDVTISSSTKLKALIYWAGLLTGKCRELVDSYDSYLKQFMWIQLFKMRFLGDELNSETYLLSEEDLESLAERHHSLKGLEEYLHRQKIQLQEAEFELRHTYNHLQTEEENYLAGHSMQQQWGLGAARAQRHPTISEVEKIFFGIGFKTSPEIGDAVQLKMLSKDFNKRSKKIMDECRTLMEQSDRSPGASYDPKKVHSIRNSLKNIRQLESQVSSLAYRTMPASRINSPILLKKSNIQVTTRSDRF